jgi:hypothetical protein
MPICPFIHRSSSPVFSGVRVTRSLVSLMCMFCRSLFVLLYFFFWPLRCLFFFDLRILITPVALSKSYLLCRYLYKVRLYEGSCLIYIICVGLCIVVFNTYCVVFFVLCTICSQFHRIVQVTYFSIVAGNASMIDSQHIVCWTPLCANKHKYSI